MIKNYFEVDGDTSIGSFLKDFKEKKNFHYLILKEEENPSFVDMRNIALKAGDFNEKVKNFKKPLFNSEADSNLDHALNLIGCGDRVVLTPEGYFDFIDALKQIKSNLDYEFLDNDVSSVDKKEIHALNRDDKISTARNLIVKNKINLLPVIDGMQVLGEVRTIDFLLSDLFGVEKYSNSDYYNEKYEDSPLNLPVINIMNERPHFVDKDSKIKDAINLMIEKKLPSLIVKEDEDIFSIISYKDIFKLVKESTKSSNYSLEFVGSSVLFEDELSIIEQSAQKMMDKVSNMSLYDSLKVTFKPLGNVEGTHQRKIMVKCLLAHGNKVLTVDKEISSGTNDEEFNDKRKGSWNIPKLVQEAFSVLEKKVRDEKSRKN